MIEAALQAKDMARVSAKVPERFSYYEAAPGEPP